MHTSVPQLQFDRPAENNMEGPTYRDLIVENKRLIMGMALACTVFGTGYAFLSKPIYETNILIQLEEGTKPANALGDLSSLFDLKTGASAEIELLRSRLIVSRAVDNSARSSNWSRSMCRLSVT
jgi:tyrosine-protein kinase Etk/Wzc